ncbi:MAG: DUF4249 domain-containing protein [Bacteroidetes bacterium]|nr:DUF4249 domain-containing protein [Bacteroidota bacterium]
MNRLYLYLFAALVLFSACEKAVSFTLDKADAKLVVDASIENGQPPRVVLTHSLDYFSRINADILARSFVHGAQIDVSNGSLTHRLKEYSVVTDAATLYYYTVDSTNPATAFVGEMQKTYDLTVQVGTETYTAKTTIPVLAKTIQSLSWKKSEKNEDSLKVMVVATVQDPPGLGNYIRYYTSVNKGPYYPGFTSVYDDQIVDGQTYEISVDQGVDRNTEVEYDNNFGLYNRGDTVVIKFANIDKATYDFWRTMEYNYQSIGSPFSSPTKVEGNVSNNALGYFGGYANQYISIIIPK